VCRDSCGDKSPSVGFELMDHVGENRQMIGLSRTDEVDEKSMRPGSWLRSHLMFSDAVRYCAVAGEGSPTVRYRAEGD